ncbi:MAG: T9SS type A sorting domain-containing protein [Chitinophagaceae bacterium]|nr:MAG: T9SS type A sorting domain-containing protein [Chitinophagaceae bacterium]
MKNLNRLMLMSALAMLQLLVSFSADAQTLTPKYGVSMGTNSPGYYEYLPQGYSASSSTKYPVIISLHGQGEMGQGNSGTLKKVLKNGPMKVISDGKMPTSFTVGGQTFKFIIVAPQFSVWPQPGAIDMIVDYVIRNYNADPTRIYLTGLSMGGGAVWEYAGSQTRTDYPKRLAAIVPVCGASYPTPYKAKGIANANLPVWAFHNEGDPTVVSWYTHDFIRYINAVVPAIKPAAKKTIWQSNSHDAWTKAYDPAYKEDNKNVYEWMLGYTRGGTAAPPPPPNVAPVVNAGTDKTITLPVSSVALLATATDADGTIKTYRWSRVSGPTAHTFSNAGIANPTVSGLTAGTYTFQVTVTDDDGATASDQVNVIVKPATVPRPVANVAPVVNAGADQTITLPANSVKLSATATDNDGTVVSYKWARYSGPTTFVLSSINIANPVLSGLVAGTYTFEVTATDDDGATGKDLVIITVKPAPATTNKPPTVDAGAAKTITLPTSTVQLSATASDADGSIKSWKWARYSGPTAHNFSSLYVSNPVLSELVAGNYKFEVTVTDDDGASAKAIVEITVKAAPAVTAKAVKVNIFGGSNTYNNSQWNNWNIGTSWIANILFPTNFKYTDGTASTVKATLTQSTAVADNSTVIPAGMAPAEVLRYTSYSTVNRTLTLTGLKANQAYNLELYSSRNGTGNSTRFVAAGTTVVVNSANNSAQKANFTSLVANGAGVIQVSIERVNTFNYINGFTLTETGTTASAARSAEIPEAAALVATPAETEAVKEFAKGISLFPNPVQDRVVLQLNNSSRGQVSVQVINASGIVVRQFNYRKDQETTQSYLSIGDLQKGIYLVRIQVGEQTETKKINKL